MSKLNLQCIFHLASISGIDAVLDSFWETRLRSRLIDNRECDGGSLALIASGEAVPVYR